MPMPPQPFHFSAAIGNNKLNRVRPAVQKLETAEKPSAPPPVVTPHTGRVA